MGPTWEPIWGWQGPDGPNVGPINFAIWDLTSKKNPIVEKRWSYILLYLHNGISYTGKMIFQDPEIFHSVNRNIMQWVMNFGAGS